MAALASRVRSLPGSLTSRAEDLAGSLAGRLLTRRNARYREFIDGELAVRDQRYGFGTGFQTLPAQLPARLTDSIAVPSGGVVLLDVALHSRGLGNLRDPFVELRSPSTGIHVRQYVERSLSARRYLNVSALRGLTDVTLTTSDLLLDRATARFIVGKQVPVPGPLLVLAPHPDDAELAAFGIYAGRDDAWVVTASAGEGGTHDYGGLFNSDPSGAILRGQMRVAESVVAPLIGGVPWQRSANLGYFDGTLTAMYLRPDQNARSEASGSEDLSLFRSANAHSLLPKRERASWAGFVADIVHLLELSGARSVVFPHPILEKHGDHSTLGLALLEALRSSKHQPEQLLAYAVHAPGGGPTASVHPVGPRDGTVSLPSWSDEQPLFDALCSIPLSEELLKKKALALDTYRDLKDAEGPLPVEDVRVRIKRGLREVYRALTVYDVGLLRRFLRPNELFFSLDIANAAAWEQRSAASIRERYGA